MSEPTASDSIGNIRVQRGERTICAAPDLAARVEKVLALHEGRGFDGVRYYCKACHYESPCPTVRILNGEEP